MMSAPAPLDWTLAGAALTLGLGASAHCLAMCSGIAAAATPPAPTPAARLRGALALNAGRLATYVLLGAAVGGAVAVTGSFDRPDGVWWPARIMVAALILGVALRLLLARDVFGIERLGRRLWVRLKPLTRRAASLPPAWRPVALGALWGLLPCGLVYSGLALAAATGSASGGALVMALFGLTTLPAMQAMGAGGASLLAWLRRRALERLAGAVLTAAALATAAPVLLPANLLSRYTVVTALDCLGAH
jgi:sulfite exporter TauE/SafE